MSNSSFTPGPWSLGKVADVKPGTRGNLFHVWRSHPKPYSEWVATVFDGGPISCFEADARLIAAAPELLALLKGLHSELVRQQINFGPYIADAEALIAKAEGR